jgi:GTP-binding protein
VNPIIAIVGRPNVGKSTLFNRLAGKKLAIVHDLPGVTRDRHYAEAHLQGRDVMLVDTGGFDPEDDDPMRKGIARHVEAAIAEADVILCVLDSISAPGEADRQAVALLRHAGKPVVYLANRADNPTRELEASELYRLGVDPLIPASALHGRNMAAVEAALVALLPAIDEDPAAEVGEEPRIALVGKPNAGKSSLLNRLSGSERSLVDERPGTTRDPINVHLTYGGKHYSFVDTAGVRRRSKVTEAVELLSVMRALRSIQRSDIVVLMCDATIGITDQDARLLSLATDRRRGIIVGLNKTDLLPKAERRKAVDQVKSALHFAPWVQIVELSAKTGQGVSQLMKQIDQVFQQYSHRVGTSELNRFFAEVLERHPPPTKSGKAPRLMYVTQAETRPPIFVAMCNAPEALAESYRRFVVNQLRTAFGFESVPVTVRYRARRRRESPDE